MSVRAAAGKTTLLSVLGGMMAPSSGDVLFDGRPLYELPLSERTALRRDRIGFVFQAFNLVPWLSACENVQVPLMLRGDRADEQRERALTLLEQVGLAERADHRPSELSQGQQQRVALARTLANDPDVILADEPTGNLDPETRQHVMRYLQQFHDQGRTIIMVTHDQEAAQFAERTIRLTAGRPEETELRASA